MQFSTKVIGFAQKLRVWLPTPGLRDPPLVAIVLGGRCPFISVNSKYTSRPSQAKLLNSNQILSYQNCVAFIGSYQRAAIFEGHWP